MAIKEMWMRNDIHFPYLFLLRCSLKPPQLNYPKHITHILHHDPGDVGHCVDVVLGVVAEAGAGDEVEVFEDGV